MSSNFAFLSPGFREFAEPSVKSERLAMGDARAASFYARFALEIAVHWLHKHDSGLRMPYDRSLGALLHEPTFQSRVPEAVFQKARAIQQAGNQAVHHQRPVRQYDALQVLKELPLTLRANRVPLGRSLSQIRLAVHGCVGRRGEEDNRGKNRHPVYFPFLGAF